MPVIRVENPATTEVVAEVEAATPDDVRSAVDAARAAQPGWAATPLTDRLEVLRRFQQLAVDADTDLADLVSSEMGKPRTEALAADVFVLLEAVRFVRKNARRALEPDAFRLGNPMFADRRSRVIREPLGVVGIISPWNYPLGIPGSQAVFALAAGNAVVLKPAEETPLVMQRMADLLREAGLPDGLLHVLPGAGASVGQAIVDADIDFLIFTGSTAVGQRLGSQLAPRGVGCTLELGGNDAAIILDDANLEVAAEGVAWARFTNAGQSCAAPKRVLVHESVADRFTKLLEARVRALRVGDGSSADDVDVGPLIHADAVEKVEGFVQDAVGRGARVAVGGERVKDLPGHFFQPTMLVDVPEDARILTEECFGPVLPVVRVRDEEHAVRLANATPYGLTASVWTRDRDRGLTLARRLDAGTVTINDHLYTFAAMETPWGGVKDSGVGRTHGIDGLLELTRAKHVNEAPAGRAWPVLWWFPYGPGMRATLRRSVRFLYAKGAARLAEAPAVLTGILGKRRS